MLASDAAGVAILRARGSVAGVLLPNMLARWRFT